MVKKLKEVENLHITGFDALPSPGEIKEEFDLKGLALETVTEGHRQVKAILDGKDNRLIVVVGPCSIHDPGEAIQYARLLKPVAEELSGDLLILMS